MIQYYVGVWNAENTQSSSYRKDRSCDILWREQHHISDSVFPYNVQDIPDSNTLTMIDTEHLNVDLKWLHKLSQYGVI